MLILNYFPFRFDYILEFSSRDKCQKSKKKKKTSRDISVILVEGKGIGIYGGIGRFITLACVFQRPWLRLGA
jgi:hypothetical protein